MLEWTMHYSTNLFPPCELLAKEQAIFLDIMEENSHIHEVSTHLCKVNLNLPVTEQKALYMKDVSHAR